MTDILEWHICEIVHFVILDFYESTDEITNVKCNTHEMSKQFVNQSELNTLKEETFAGRNFRGFAVFSEIRESLFPRKFSKDVIRESFFPRNFLKKSSSANIL